MLHGFRKVAVASLMLFAAARSTSAQDGPKVYTVNYASTVPTIDGLLTSESEWSAAGAGGDTWALLSTGFSDGTQNRFVALWDQSGLYFQHQVNYAGWQNRGSAWDPLYESLNFYFDPNTDQEPNENTAVFGIDTDGYHLGINQPQGESEINGPTITAGYTGEFYVDALFGEESSWLPSITMKQTNSTADKVGYLEAFIPWTEFNKTDPSSGGIDPLTDEIGLFHPGAPVDGEEWYFNLTRAQTNGFLPAWNSPPGAFFFSERPHGILKFAGTAADPCDIDRDGDCDAEDVDTITRELLSGDPEPRFDFNNDGAISDTDRTYYIEDMLNTWIGDSNLDGQFGTQDFVAVFVFGQYEDDIPGNSGWAAGDWDGDLDFSTRDFVAAFVSGGFELGPRPVGAVAAVPEPGSGGLLLLGVLGLTRQVNSRRRLIAP